MDRLRKFFPLLTLLAPTLLGFAIDLVSRGGSIWALSLRGKFGWFATSIAGAGLWLGVLYALARLSLSKWKYARQAYAAIFALIIFPFSVFAYGVQAYYVYVFNAYITRDTLRLGIAFNGTVASWMRAWGIKLVPGVILGLIFTYLLARAVRAQAVGIARTRWWAALIAALGTVYVFSADYIHLQEWLTTPDSSFEAAVIGYAQDCVSPRRRQGLTYRKAVAVPPLPAPTHRPNVLLVITESVRADILCSERTPQPSPNGCTSRFFDEAIPDRSGLLRMTSQSSGTITSCMVLWTGLAPNATLEETHTTPFLWDVAKAQGYRTAYIASQDLRAFELGPYLKNARIDLKISGEDFGDVQEIHIGCPDEEAAGRMLRFAKEETGPWFAVLHLANTHYPYRVDPNLQPFAPHDDSPFEGQNSEPLRNQIRNSVLFQERTMASFYSELRKLPSFDDTVTIFVSDHGEQLREHGALFHLNSLFDEEIRIPGFVFAGKTALSRDQRKALGTFHDRRTYGEDINASVLDLLGAFDARGTFPNGALLTGRSIFRPAPAAEPIVAMSTVSGVWYGDRPVYGVEQGERKLLAGGGPWVCLDLTTDPLEKHILPASACPPEMLQVATQKFPGVAQP